MQALRQRRGLLAQTMMSSRRVDASASANSDSSADRLASLRFHDQNRGAASVARHQIRSCRSAAANTFARRSQCANMLGRIRRLPPRRTERLEVHQIHAICGTDHRLGPDARREALREPGFATDRGVTPGVDQAVAFDFRVGFGALQEGPAQAAVVDIAACVRVIDWRNAARGASAGAMRQVAHAFRMWRASGRTAAAPFEFGGVVTQATRQSRWRVDDRRFGGGIVPAEVAGPDARRVSTPSGRGRVCG